MLQPSSAANPTALAHNLVQGLEVHVLRFFSQTLLAECDLVRITDGARVRKDWCQARTTSGGCSIDPLEDRLVLRVHLDGTIAILDGTHISRSAAQQQLAAELDSFRTKRQVVKKEHAPGKARFARWTPLAHGLHVRSDILVRGARACRAKTGNA